MRFTRAGVVVASAALALALAGCTGSASHLGASAPTQTAWTEAPTAASPNAGSASFSASSTADQNRTAFDAAIRATLAHDPKADGPAVVGALKAAGFPMSATQVSASTTSAHLQPGSISVGVKIGNDCLIGQWGAAVDGYQSTVQPALGSGGCLIGGIPVVG